MRFCQNQEAPPLPIYFCKGMCAVYGFVAARHTLSLQAHGFCCSFLFAGQACQHMLRHVHFHGGSSYLGHKHRKIKAY